ncbi:MAG: hypothetical protein AAF589_05730 [Planctomycetota bacterium]
MPAGTQLLGATAADGRSLAVSELGPIDTDADQNLFVVETPIPTKAGARADDRNTPVDASPSGETTLTYRQASKRSDLRVDPLLPVGDATRTLWHWTVLVPSKFSSDGVPLKRHDWRRRLFGPLAGGASATPFNPLRLADWQRLTRFGSFGDAFEHEESDSSGSDEDFGLVGWRTYEAVGVLTAPESIVLARESTNRAWPFALQWVIMAIAAWRLPRFGAGYVYLLLTCAVVALVCPDGLSPWASAVWYGVALAVPLRWLLGGLSSWKGLAQRLPGSHRGLASSGAPVSVAFCIACSSLAGAAEAEETRPSRVLSQRSPAVERVLVPVDAEGEPVGGKHYVRESLLRSLLTNQQARARGVPSEVLITGVDHQGELTRETRGGQVATGRWTTTLHLRTMRRGAIVRLPIEQDDATWAQSVALDGVPSPLQWHKDDGASFVVPEPGVTTAVLTYEPRVVFAEGESCVHLHGMATPGSRLRVDIPASLADVRAPLAAVADREASGALTAVFGEWPDLLVCWTDGERVPSADVPAIDLLQRFKVTKQGISVSVRAVAESGDVALTLPTPPGWSSGENAAEAVRLLAATNDKTTGPGSTATFSVERLSPFGILRVGPLEVTGAKVRRQLVEVEVGAGLRCLPAENSTIEQIPPRDFTARWLRAEQSPPADWDETDDALTPAPSGNSDSTSAEKKPARQSEPQRIAAELEGDAAWLLRIEPETSSSRETVARAEVVLGQEQALCRVFVDRLATEQSYLILETTAGFDVESILLASEGTSATPIWRQPNRQRLLIFLPAERSEDARLEIAGVVALADQTPVVPTFSLRTGEASRPVEVALFREDDTVVEFIDTLPEGRPSSAAAVTGGRLAWSVASMRSDQLDEPVPLHITPNPISCSTETMTAVRRADNGLLAEWSAELRVESGVLGTVPLRLAAATGGEATQVEDLRLQSPVGATLVEPPNGAGPREIRLARPLEPGATVRLNLLASCGQSASGAIAAPLFRLPQAWSTTNFAAAPSPAAASNADPTRWRMVGMQRRSPQAVANNAGVDLLPADLSWRIMEANEVGDTAAAVFWTAASTPDGVLRIPYAEFDLLRNEKIESVVTARFVIEPNGRTHCTIEVPKDHRLDRVTIDHAVTTLRARSPRTCEVELRSPSAAQMLEVVVISPSQGALALPPRIAVAGQGERLPEEVVWRVVGEGVHGLEAPPNGRRVSAPVAQVVRLRRLLAAARSCQSPSDAWLRIWRERIKAAADRVAALYPEGLSWNANSDSDSTENRAKALASPQALVEAARAWLASLETQDVPAELNLERPSQLAWDEPAYFIATSPAEVIAPRVVAATDTDLLVRLTIAVAAIAATVVGRRRLGKINLAAAYEHRHALAAVGGVLWWLTLQPSFIGLLLLTASVAGQLRLLAAQLRSTSGQ